jgi:hypothetical protein
MRPNRARSLFISLLLLLTVSLFGGMGYTAWAEDVETMLKQVNKELRQAQKDMFAGKTDNAIAALDKIKDLLAKAKAAEPDDSRIKTAENKYSKLVKDLERRTGKDLGGGSLTSQSTSTKTKLPPKPATEAVPEKTPAVVTAAADTGNVKTLSGEALKLLRDAEKSMFGGKKDEAMQQLTEAGSLIDKIKATDPKNPQLSSLENKYGQIQKKIEAKTPKEAPAPAAQAQPAAVKGAGPSVKVPYAARKPLQNATRQLSGLDALFGDLADPKYPGDKDQLVKRIEGRMAGARESLDQAKALAAQKGVTSHPEFDKVEADLATAEKKVAQAKGGYEEAKAVATAKSEEVDADVKNLQAEYDRISPVFQGATGTVIYYNDLEPVEKLIVQIEDFEKNDIAKIQEKMGAFAKKYGSTREEIDKKAESMGYTGRSRASFAYTEFQKGIGDVKKTRIVMAEDLVKKGNEMLTPGRTGHDFSVVEHYAKVKAWIKMAGRYDPENPKVKEALGSIDARIAEGMKAFHAGIDKRTWPEHAANAPKNAKELAGEALAWFKNNPDWGKRSKDPRKPLAVVVTGPWSIQKKNILGEPIMYGLPILLAVQVDSDKDMNAARVYSLTMRTVEKRGVKMEPPFDHITVGNSYFIRPDKVK